MNTPGEDIVPEVRRWVEVAEQLLLDSKFQEAAEAFHAASIACLDLLPRPAAIPTADELARIELAMGNIAQRVADGQCILFLGAGVHYPLPAESPFVYPPEQRPPLGPALSEQLAAKCNFCREFPRESACNLQRVLLFLEKQTSRQKLIDEVSQRVGGEAKKPSTALRALARLKFQLAITTNYDQAFRGGAARRVQEAQSHRLQPRPQ
jgi:hypothetical protein